MPYLPVKGSGGTVTIGTGPAVPVNGVGKWSLKRKAKTDDAGPYVNQPDVIEILGSVTYDLDIEFDVIAGGDPGQDAILTAMHDGTHPQLVLTTLGGKIVTMATPLYKDYDLGLDAAKTQTFKTSMSGTVAKPTQSVVAP